MTYFGADTPVASSSNSASIVSSIFNFLGVGANAASQAYQANQLAQASRTAGGTGGLAPVDTSPWRQAAVPALIGAGVLIAVVVVATKKR